MQEDGSWSGSGEGESAEGVGGVVMHIWHTIGATGGQKTPNQEAANARD